MEYYGQFSLNYPCYSFLSGAMNIQGKHLDISGRACCCQVTFLILFIQSSSTAQTYPEYTVFTFFSCQSSGISVNSLGKQKNICVKGNQTLSIFSGVTTFLSYGFLQIRNKTFEVVVNLTFEPQIFFERMLLSQERIGSIGCLLFPARIAFL